MGGYGRDISVATCHGKQQILVMRNRRHVADCSLAVWSPQCHTSRSVVERAILIPAVRRAWSGSQIDLRYIVDPLRVQYEGVGKDFDTQRVTHIYDATLTFDPGAPSSDAGGLVCGNLHGQVHRRASPFPLPRRPPPTRPRCALATRGGSRILSHAAATGAPQVVCYDATYEGTRGELRYRSFWEKEANNQPTQSFWTQSSGNVVRQAPFPPSRGQQSALTQR